MFGCRRIRLRCFYSVLITTLQRDWPISVERLEERSEEELYATNLNAQLEMNHVQASHLNLLVRSADLLQLRMVRASVVCRDGLIPLEHLRRKRAYVWILAE